MMKDLVIENDLRQLLIGSLLGDGSFCSVGRHAKNKCLSIAHSIEQRAYLEYKWNILNKYNLVPRIRETKIVNPRYTHELVECRVKTRLHPIFTEIRNNRFCQGYRCFRISNLVHGLWLCNQELLYIVYLLFYFRRTNFIIYIAIKEISSTF